ncbi:hypothetical protein ACIQZG_22115 [Lysinibacillus sp. NPDC096418]|uniref:hypothetical protein n=1 Tax=Lysinibacillus sp. NPDC096418 TaxID=3364138 RepID=UPI003808EC16
MIKRKFKGSEGWITSYAFLFLGKKWIVAISEKKWHEGEKYKRMPIWVSKIRNEVPAVFIWNIAIGFDKRKNNKHFEG